MFECVREQNREMECDCDRNENWNVIQSMMRKEVCVAQLVERVQ